MNTISLIPSAAPIEPVFASAQRPHLAHFYSHDDGGVESVVAAASLAAAIQIARERLAGAELSVAEVIREEPSGDISILTGDSFLLVSIRPSALMQPVIDRDVRRACAELERGDLSQLAALFTPARATAAA